MAFWPWQVHATVLELTPEVKSIERECFRFAYLYMCYGLDRFEFGLRFSAS